MIDVEPIRLAIQASLEPVLVSNNIQLIISDDDADQYGTAARKSQVMCGISSISLSPISNPGALSRANANVQTGSISLDFVIRSRSLWRSDSPIGIAKLIVDALNGQLVKPFGNLYFTNLSVVGHDKKSGHWEYQLTAALQNKLASNREVQLQGWG